MNFKHTWLWLFVAAGLFAFIFFYQRHDFKPPAGPVKILPGLKPATVTAIQVTARGQLALRVERTNDTWKMLEPVPYPAQSANIDILLAVLEQLVPARHFSESELTNRFNADKNYGFADPQATILLEQPGESFPPVRIGTNTAPGDQVFLQVVGRDEIYVVDVSLLKYIPRSPNDWRDSTFIRLKEQPFDSLTVTSGNDRLTFQNDPATHLWRMTFPFEGRADNAKIAGFVQALERARVQQFVSDQPNPDLEAFGLQPPEHELTLAQGTNLVSRLQFGKSPTNDPGRVYAHRAGRNTIVTLPKEVLAPWSASMQMNDYRDPYLLHLNEPLTEIEVHGEDNFSLLRQTNETWRVLPQDFQADATSVKLLLSQLGQLKVAEFTAANVPETRLPEYGLVPPLRQYLLKAAPAGTATNAVLNELSFGTTTNRADVVFARRADEKSVYAVPLADFRRLFPFAHQYRERRIWHFSINDVAGATIRQEDKVRYLKRNGPHSWSLARDSQGVIDDLAIEETVAGLCDLTATSWVTRGAQYLPQFGLAPGLLQITLEFKNGDKATLDLGKPFPASPNRPFAAVTLEGQVWIFEFPIILFPDVSRYLTLP